MARRFEFIKVEHQLLATYGDGHWHLIFKGTKCVTEMEVEQCKIDILARLWDELEKEMAGHMYKEIRYLRGWDGFRLLWRITHTGQDKKTGRA